MKRAAGGPQDKIHVIPNGVNFAQFRPLARVQARAALRWDPDRYYVLFSNNPQIPVKNFALAQAAIEHLRELGMNAELVVANGLPHDTVVQYMNASNALLLSSVAEGSPNVVKEAMACNVPVVSTNVGDVADVIGKTEGCSVCSHDAEALAEGLEKALRHSKRTTGREDIQHLDSAVVAQQVINVYKKAIGKYVEDGEVGTITKHPKETVYAKET
jgi:glycosyltransferase involved in cell wall biosynthesis